MESRAALGVVVCVFGFEILEGRDVQVAKVCPRCVGAHLALGVLQCVP